MGRNHYIPQQAVACLDGQLPESRTTTRPTTSLLLCGGGAGRGSEFRICNKHEHLWVLLPGIPFCVGLSWNPEKFANYS